MTRAAVFVLLAAIGCGGSEVLGDPPDAGSRPNDASAIAAPEAAQSPLMPETIVVPAQPASTIWGECPAGWSLETSPRTFSELTCRPYSVALDCPEGQVQLPGMESCSGLGPCPAGDYNERLPPSSNVIYVRLEESLAAAIAAAPPNAVLALPKREYSESIDVPPGISLIGACAPLTRIAGASVAGVLRELAVAGELHVEGGSAELAGVSAGALLVRGGRVRASHVRAGRFEAFAGADVHLSQTELGGDLSIDATSFVRIFEGRLRGEVRSEGELEMIVVAASAPISFFGPTGVLSANDLHSSAAIALEGGARAYGFRWMIDGAEAVALALAGPETSANLQTVVIKNTRASPADQKLGRGIVVEDGASLDLRFATLQANLDFGVLVNNAGSTAIIEDLVVRDTHPNSVDLTHGVALTAHNGAVLSIARAYLEDNSAGLAVGESGAALELSDVTIFGDHNPANGGVGYGMAILGGATVLERVWIAESRFHGTIVSGAETAVSGTDLWITHTEPQALDGLYGRGLGVEGGARVELNRVFIEGSYETGVSAIDPRTAVLLTDATIADTRPRSADGLAGYGLLAQGGGSVLLERAFIESATKVGVVSTDSTLSLSDVTVLGTRSDGGGEYGIGVAAVSSTVTFARVSLEHNRHSAIRIEGEGSILRGHDLSISETLGQFADAKFGAGLLVLRGARAEVSRLSVADCSVYAIGVYHPGSRLIASDVRAERTGYGRADGLYANGLVVQDHASAAIERARFVDNAQVGVLAQIAATIELSDVEIRGTRKACASQAEECLDQAGGVGAGSYASSSISLTNFVISNNSVAGAAIARGGTLDLHRGEIINHPIGINVETEAFDTSRLEDGVSFTNNVVNFSAARLPVPDVLEEIPSPLR